MKLRSLIFIGMFCMLNFASFAQSKVIFDKNTIEKFVIRNTNADNIPKKIILNKLANGNSLNINSLKLDFSFKESLQILKVQNRLTFLVSLSDVKITGHTKYRGFPIGELLIPSQMTFNLIWKKKNGTVVNRYNFNNIEVSARETTQAVNKTVIDTTGKENYFIEIKNQLFLYDMAGKIKFDNKVKLIDDYYAEAKNTKNKIKEIEKINFREETLRHLKNIEVVFDYKDLATKSIQYAEKTKTLDFYMVLPLKHTDPKRLMDKTRKLKNISQKLLTTSQHIIDELHIIYYERGMEMLQRGNRSQADAFFKKSIQIRNDFAPSHLQIANILYNTGYTIDAVNKIFQIRAMNPDPKTKKYTIELANGIYKDFILEASYLNNSRKYDQALTVISRAKKLCTDFPEVKCNANMDNEYNRAIIGKYNIVLANVDITFKNGKLYDSEQILQTAKDFRNKHIYVIQDDKTIVTRLENIYFKYIEIGNNQIRKQKYNQALKNLYEARRMCTSYSEIPCTDALNKSIIKGHKGVYTQIISQAKQSFSNNRLDDSETELQSAISYRMKYSLRVDAKEDALFAKIKQKRYNNAIESGLRYEKSRNFKEALQAYDKARYIAGKHPVKGNKYLNRYVNGASENYILQIIADGQRNVLANVLPEARQLYSLAIDIQTQYKQLANKKVNNALTMLKDKIFKQECVNAQTKYDNIFSEAMQLVSAKKYIEASRKFDDAIRHANDFSYCSIRSENSSDKKAEIADAVEYQLQMQNMYNNIDNLRFQSAITEYLSAGELYSAKNVARFKLNHKVLYDFILQQNNANFTNFSADYFADKHEFNKAMRLLTVLKQSGFLSRETKPVQIKLGTMLATNDFNKNHSSDWKSGVAKYTAGDRFYKFFKRAYKKQWKRLD